MKTKSEQIELIIEFLEHAKLRPAMYFGSQDNISLVQSFLDGIRQSVLLLLDLDKYSHITIWDEVARKMGHNFSPLRISPKLRDEFLTDADRVLEFVKIEIEFWKVYRDQLKEN